jgi:endoglycosylceramidase
VLNVSWSTIGPGKTAYRTDTDTIIKVPATVYPKGYTATVTGGRVTSKPNATELTVTNNSGATRVSVHLQPA